MAGRFTDSVRQEVSRAPVDARTATVELSAIVRLVGVVTRSSHEEGLALEITTTSGAVARRTHHLLERGFGARPELLVRSPGGVRASSTYRVRLPAAGALARRLGVLDDSGGLTMPTAAEARPDPVAWIRGLVLAGASFSAPGRAPHFEVVAATRAVAEVIAGVLGEHLDTNAHVSSDLRRDERHRVVVKSGEAIGRLLALVGASQAFLEWDDHRLRRQLRNDANRLANADAANVRRSVETSSAQILEIEQAIERLGWHAIDDELREVALARLANASASLAELGELCDPPIAKSTVRRRLKRLVELGQAEGAEDAPAGRVDEPSDRRR